MRVSEREIPTMSYRWKVANAQQQQRKSISVAKKVKETMRWMVRWNSIIFLYFQLSTVFAVRNRSLCIFATLPRTMMTTKAHHSKLELIKYTQFHDVVERNEMLREWNEWQCNFSGKKLWIKILNLIFFNFNFKFPLPSLSRQDESSQQLLS